MVALLLLLAAFLAGAFLPAGPPEVDQEAEVPAVVLVSEAGRQEGVQGSACVGGPASGYCIDAAAPVEPEELSVVRPGETVEIALEGELDGTGVLVVRVLGCGQEAASVPLESPAPWTVDLEPGAYALEVFYEFEGEGLSGDTSVALGLLVDRAEPAVIVPIDSTVRACPDG
ncbi:MAG TPA: hypothetical protein VK915_03345 [Gaiellaceae bacterium]|nr:hypothetical protein [Gaiellaceae bacterium]